VTWQADQRSDKTRGPKRLKAQKAGYVMVGRLKRKGVRNISFTRKQDPDL